MLAALFCLAAVAAFAFLARRDRREHRGANHRPSDRYSDVALTTQHGEPVGEPPERHHRTATLRG
jgi:hypothetical protein